MKRIFMLLTAGIVALVLSACAAPGAPVPTPAQILAQVNTQACPGLVAAGPVFETLPGITDADKAILVKVNTDIAKVCAKGAQLSAINLQTLTSSSLPAALSIVQALPPFPQQAAIVGGIGAVQILLPILIAQAKAIAATEPVPDAGTPSAVSVPPAATVPA